MIAAMASPKFPPGWHADAMTGPDKAHAARAAWSLALVGIPGPDANRFRWYLQATGYGTADVGRLLGMDRRTVARWQAGKLPVRDEDWQRLVSLAALA